MKLPSHQKLTTNILRGGAAQSCSEAEQFKKIKAKAQRLAFFQGRATAIAYIQDQRYWLNEYFRGGVGIPASGTLLDQWEVDSPWRAR